MLVSQDGEETTFRSIRAAAMFLNSDRMKIAPYIDSGKERYGYLIYTADKYEEYRKNGVEPCACCEQPPRDIKVMAENEEQNVPKKEGKRDKKDNDKLLDFAIKTGVMSDDMLRLVYEDIKDGNIGYDLFRGLVNYISAVERLVDLIVYEKKTSSEKIFGANN